MSSELDKLRRQVEVLREACEEWRGSAVTSYDAYGAGLVDEADRIAAEPVEETGEEVWLSSWRTLLRWSAREGAPFLVLANEYVRMMPNDSEPVDCDSPPMAAAWVRAQGGAS